MPRTQRRPGSGGARTGDPNTLYSQRTDLNENKSLPVTTVPNQPYGQATQQAAVQQQTPMPDNTTQPAPAGPIAGGLGAFDRPSARPQEPITAGLPIGAGAGPEALGMAPVAKPRISQTLAQIAEASGSPELLALAQHAMAQGK